MPVLTQSLSVDRTAFQQRLQPTCRGRRQPFWQGCGSRSAGAAEGSRAAAHSPALLLPPPPGLEHQDCCQVLQP